MGVPRLRVARMKPDAPVVQALLDEVWNPHVARSCRLFLRQDKCGYYVLAIRYQGDVVCSAAKYLRRSALTTGEPGRLVRELDRTVFRLVHRFRPLTTSDALIAGERRRLVGWRR